MKTNLPRGFTVVEVLVCVGIIGVLLALVLPAVQKARESGRLLDCKNRLRQIGLASHSFHEAHRAFPRISESLRGLMPYLDLQNMHDRMVELEKTRSSDRASIGTAPVFACPSGDVNPAIQEVSFVTNSGTRLNPYFQAVESNGMMLVDFPRQSPVRLSDVTDGTSNTAFWSETLAWQKNRIQNKDSEPGLYWRQIAEQPNSILDLQRLCRTAKGRHKEDNLIHTLWGDSHYYQHISPPNSLPCAWDYALYLTIASKPPSSAHVSGVNVLRVDGSVQFVSDTIDELTWRELGSRNSDDDFSRF